ncbi:Kinesin light chain 3 [Cladochytrium tenue]|nr:Kinesin light chain 3 [Cladochytrium tenue]
MPAGSPSAAARSPSPSAGPRPGAFADAVTPLDDADTPDARECSNRPPYAAQPPSPAPPEPTSPKPAKRLFDLREGIQPLPEVKNEDLRVYVGQINTFGQIADLYADMGFHDKSVRVCKRLLDVKKRCFGPDSYPYVAELLSLASQFERFGYMKRARKTLEEVDEVLERVDWELPSLQDHIAMIGERIAKKESDQPEETNLPTSQNMLEKGFTQEEAEAWFDAVLESEKIPEGVQNITIGERPSLSQLGGVKALGSMTTTEFCGALIMPLTASSQLSFCDTVAQKGFGHLLQPANYFVSHAWRYSFVEVFEALDLFFEEREELPTNTYIWFDLFTNSQHNTATRPFEWWENTFLSAVKAIKNVVMVLQPWNDPIPLTRAWCVFELFSCRRTGSEFHVALSSKELRSLIEGLRRDPSDFHKMLLKSSCLRSESTNITDRDNIFAAIDRMIGSEELDKMVARTFEDWLIRRLDKFIDIPPDGSGRAFIEMIRRPLNNMMELEDESEATTKIEDLEEISEYYFALGYWRFQLGRYRAAWDPIKAAADCLAALDGLESSQGLKTHKLRMASLLLSRIYEKTGRFTESRAVTKSAIDSILSKDGPDCIDLVGFRNVDATMDIADGNAESATALLHENLKAIRAAQDCPLDVACETFDLFCRVSALHVSPHAQAEYLGELRDEICLKFEDAATDCCKDSFETFCDAAGLRKNLKESLLQRLEQAKSQLDVSNTENQTRVKRLVDFYLAEDDFDAAEGLVSSHTETLQHTMDATNVVSLMWKSTLGAVYHARGEDDKAAECLQALFETLESTFQPVSYMLARIRGNSNEVQLDPMAHVDRRSLKTLFDYAQCIGKSKPLVAVSKLFDILEPQRLYFGDGDFDYLDSKMLAGELARSLGETYEEWPIALAKDTYERSTYFHGSHHPKTIDYAHRLAKIYASLGNTDDALGLADRCLQLADPNLGPHSRATLDIHDAIVDIYIKAGRFPDLVSRNLVDLVYRRKAAALGASHPSTLAAGVAAADHWCAGGAPERAADLLGAIRPAAVERLGEKSDIVVLADALLERVQRQLDLPGGQ